jgi:tetratricopeptide (TPR) repeat protein
MQDAVRMADALASEKPGDADAVASRVSLMGTREELEGALPAMEAVREKSPDNPLLRFNLGRTYALRGEWEMAQSHFSEALRLKPDYLQASLALGELQFSTDKFEAAVEVADEVLEKNSRNRAASMLKVRSLAKLRRYAEARQTLAALIAAMPMAEEFHFQMGLLGLTEKKWEQAGQAFEKAYQLNPGSVQAVAGLVQSLEARKRFDLVSAFLQREIGKYPDRRDLRILLAQAAMRAGNPDLAIGEYKAVLKAAAGGQTQAGAAQTAAVQVLLGEAYAAKGDREAAMTSLEQARAGNPADPSVWLSMAKVLDASGRRQKARECYEQVLKLDPENVMALNELAYLLAESDSDLDLALTYAQRAKQKLPLVDEFSDTLGWIYLKKRLSKSAIAIFEPLTVKDPGRATYRYHLGAALLAVGERARAQKELELALRSNPSREEAGKIRELIGKM